MITAENARKLLKKVSGNRQTLLADLLADIEVNLEDGLRKGYTVYYYDLPDAATYLDMAVWGDAIKELEKAGWKVERIHNKICIVLA